MGKRLSFIKKQNMELVNYDIGFTLGDPGGEPVQRTII